MKLFTTLLLAASTASSFAIAEETILVTKTITSAANIEQDLADVLPSASVITRWEIEQSPAATIIDLLQSEPGIEIGRNGGPGTVSSIFMRGQASKNVAVFVDGVRLQTDALGSVLYNIIPLTQIDRIEILRGNMSALYGSSAVGGAIHIFTKSGITADSFNANVTYGSRDTQELDLSFRGKSDDISYTLSLNEFSTENRSAINPLQKPTTDSDTDSFKNTGIISRIEWAPSVDKKLGINLSKSTGRIDYDGTYYVGTYPNSVAHNDGDFYANQESDSLSIYGSGKVTAKSLTSFKITRSSYSYHEFIEGDGQTPKKANQTVFTVNNSVDVEKGTITFGTEISDADYTDASNTVNRATQSVFTGVNGNLSESIDYQLNIRHDSTDTDNKISSTSQKESSNTWLLGSGYDLNKSIRATALYSTSFAAPTADEFAGNPNLNAEEHKGYELGIEYKTSNWKSGLTYFKNRSSSAIIYTNNGYENISYDNAGFEFDLSGSIDQINYKLSHVIQNPKDETGERLSRRAKNYSTLELSGLYNSYDWLAQIIYSGDRDNSYWDDQILKSYTVANFSISKKINNDWSAKLKFENLFNKEYQLAYSYDAVPFGAFLSIQYQPK